MGTTDNASAPYTVRFSRIGRHHDVGPLHLDATDADDLAEQVYKYARRFLGSRDVEVAVNLEEMRGLIFAGMRNGGDFTIERNHTVHLPLAAERAVANVLVEEYARNARRAS